MNDNPYTEGPRRKNYSFQYRKRSAALSMPKLLSCHFCGNSWDSKNRCFVCPKCHTPFNPLKSPTIGFGGEVKVARMRANITQAELAKLIGCAEFVISRIERGQEVVVQRTKSKIIREKLRIWIEGTKSPIDRREEIDNMFNSPESETK